MCKTTGAKFELFYESKYIPTINTAEQVRLAKNVSEKYFGKANWITMKNASMGAEDFSFYLDKYPGALCFLGLGHECPGLHNPKFNFNDDGIEYGIKYMVGITLEAMRVEL